MFNYKCIRVTGTKKVGEEYGSRIVMVNLHFENEHGFKFKMQRHVIVAIRDGVARIVKSPEDFLPETAPENTWDMFEKLCKVCPGPPYGVSNEEEFSTFF